MQKTERLFKITALALTMTVLLASMTTMVADEGMSLLYLVEFSASDAGAPGTRDQAIALLAEQIVPSLEMLAKSSDIRAGGLAAGARGGAFVVAAKSHDEVTEMLRALPAWGVWRWTVTPLESFAYRAELEKKVIQKLRAQT